MLKASMQGRALRPALRSLACSRSPLVCRGVASRGGAGRMLLAAAPAAGRGGRCAPRPAHNQRHDNPVMSFSDLFETSGENNGNTKPAAKAGKKAAVTLSMVQQVEFGQHLRLIGSAGELGQWDAGYGPDMQWHDGNKWTACVALAPGTHEFKFARVHRSGEVEWEPGNNRQLEVPPSAAELQVAASWGQTQETEVLELREKATFEQQRRQQQKKMLDDDAAASRAAAAAAIKQREVSAAAAAADTLAQMLQHASRAGAEAAPTDSLDDASDAAAAAKAAAAASDQEVQNLAEAVAAAATDIELLEALSAAVAHAAGASGVPPPGKLQKVAGKARAEPSVQRAAAAKPSVEQPASAVVAGSSDHQELVRMLSDLRSDMASSMGEVATTMHDVQGELSAVQQQMETLKAERATLALAAGAGDSEEEASGIREIDATLNNMKAKASTAAGAKAGSAGASAAAAAGDPAALSGLHSAVLSWRHELLSFRQDSSELRQEIDVVKGALVVVENQLELTATSVSTALQGVEQQLQANTSAVSGVKDTVKSVADSVSGLLLLRLDQLRDELRAEVQELVGVMQTSGSGRANGNGRAVVPGVVCDEDAAASVVGLLQSSSTALWFKGFLYCIMMATGLWSEGLQDEIKGEAMRLTWQAYTGVWPEEQLNSWRHQLSKQDQLVQAAATGGMNNSTKPLALHALWSITELSRHSMQVRMLLQAICTPEEADLVMQLRPGGDATACAKVLRRWMTAANAAASAAASVTVPPPAVGAGASW